MATHRIRLQATGPHGIAAYVTVYDGRVACVTPGGTSASLFYAGVFEDEALARFALEDARSPDAALEALRKFSHYEIALLP